MKHNINIMVFALLFANLQILKFSNCLAQVPQKFNYQGIARDAKANPMAKQQIALKLSVLPTSDATVPEYEEIQTVTTNEFGLYTLQIGNGASTSLSTFKDIKWETGNKYIRVAIDPKGGSDFVDAGTNQLLSVPYAIYADKAGMAKNAGGDRTGTVSSNATHVSGDTNFLTKFTGLNVIGKSQLFDNGTNVGIGTTSPLFKLHIQKPTGNADILVRTLDTTGAASLRLRNSAGAELGINKFGPNATGNFMGIPRANMAAVNNFTTGPFVFNSGSDIVFGNTVGSTQIPRMFVSGATGNVGFGTLTPTAKLDVNGQVRIQGGAPGAGKVLTSDTSGLATWQLPGADSQWARNGTHIFNKNSGNVGIGTNIPKARLNVADSAVLFSAIGDTAIATFNNKPPIEGAGRRMMWYPERGAFRAGGLAGSDSLNWNRDSVGAYSVAMGWNTLAKGRSSFAMGDNTTASGNRSTALGSSTTASGNASTALGESTKASGEESIAMGSFTKASGVRSTAMGSSSIASGDRSTAMGLGTNANEFASTSMGALTFADGDASTAMGRSTKAKGASSTSMGFETRANGFASLVIGQFNDSIVASQTSIQPTTPLFIIGNGTGLNALSNAMVVQNDGKVGIGTNTPQFKLHVSNSNPAADGYIDGIMVENTNVNTGEAAISFRNKSMDSTRQWILGVNQNPSMSLAYGNQFSNGNTKLILDTTGSLGLGTTSPNPSALTDMTSTTKGFLPPRMTSAQRDAIVSPAEGLVIYNTTTKCLNFFIGTVWNGLCGTAASAFVTSLNCNAATTTGSLVESVPATGVSSSVPYTGGNGLSHSGQIVTSTGVLGLSATLVAGTLVNGNGNLVYTITGTPATAGTANFVLNIAGQTCILSIVVAPQPAYPPGSVFCAGATIVVDVTNPVTGKTWMDRNLGASQAIGTPGSLGDLYQWGRRSDGHQCRNSFSTDTLSSIDQPAHGRFIRTTANISDWRSPQNGNLWQGVNGANNPCPSGYRIPTDQEWTAERLSWSSNNAIGAGNSTLKLTSAGERFIENGVIFNVGSSGRYWSSTVTTAIFGFGSQHLFFNSLGASVNGFNRGNGLSVRCIKD